MNKGRSHKNIKHTWWEGGGNRKLKTGNRKLKTGNRKQKLENSKLPGWGGAWWEGGGVCEWAPQHQLFLAKFKPENVNILKHWKRLSETVLELLFLNWTNFYRFGCLQNSQVFKRSVAIFRIQRSCVLVVGWLADQTRIYKGHLWAGRLEIVWKTKWSQTTISWIFWQAFE